MALATTIRIKFEPAWFPPKNKGMNSTLLTMKPQVDLFSFIFWRKLKTQKEISKLIDL